MEKAITHGKATKIIDTALRHTEQNCYDTSSDICWLEDSVKKRVSSDAK